MDKVQTCLATLPVFACQTDAKGALTTDSQTLYNALMDIKRPWGKILLSDAKTVAESITEIQQMVAQLTPQSTTMENEQRRQAFILAVTDPLERLQRYTLNFTNRTTQISALCKSILALITKLSQVDKADKAAPSSGGGRHPSEMQPHIVSRPPRKWLSAEQRRRGYVIVQTAPGHYRRTRHFQQQ